MRGNYLFAMASAVVQESVLRSAQICSKGRQRSMAGAGGRGREGKGGKRAPPKMLIPWVHGVFLFVLFCWPMLKGELVGTIWWPLRAAH